MENNLNGLVDEASNDSDVCEIIEPDPPKDEFVNNIASKNFGEPNVSEVAKTQHELKPHANELETQNGVQLKECKIKLPVLDKQFISKALNGDINKQEEPIATKNGTEIEGESMIIAAEVPAPKQEPAVAITNDTPKKKVDSGSLILDEANSFLDSTKKPKLPPVHGFLFSVGKGLVLEACLRDIAQEEKKEAKKLEAASSTPDSEDDDQTNASNEKDQVGKCSSALEKLKVRNAVFNSKTKSCTNCGFKTESELVLQEHLQTVPHYNMRGRLICPVCDIPPMKERTALFTHMKDVHDCIPRFERTVAHPCRFCYYDAHTPVHLSKHLVRCMKYFNLSANLAPPKGFTPALVIPSVRRPPPPQAQPSPAQPMVRGAQQPTVRPGLVQNIPPRMVNGNHNRPTAAPLHNRHPAILGKAQPGIAAQNRASINRGNELQMTGSGGSRANNQVMMNSLGDVVYVGATKQNVGGTRVTRNSPVPASNFGSGSRGSPGPAYGGALSAAAGGQRSQRTPSRPQIAPQPKPDTKRPLTACDICAEFMTDKTDFKKHLLSVHNINLHTFQYKGVDRDMLLCGICNAYFTTFVGVQHHMSKNHPEKFKASAAAAGPGVPKRTRPEASTSGGQSLNGGLPRRSAAPAQPRHGGSRTVAHPCRYCGISFVNMSAHVVSCQFRPVNNGI